MPVQTTQSRAAGRAGLLISVAVNKVKLVNKARKLVMKLQPVYETKSKSRLQFYFCQILEFVDNPKWALGEICRSFFFFNWKYFLHKRLLEKKIRIYFLSLNELGGLCFVLFFWKHMNLVLGKDFSYSFLNIFISHCSPSPSPLINELYIFMLQLEMKHSEIYWLVCLAWWHGSLWQSGTEPRSLRFQSRLVWIQPGTLKPEHIIWRDYPQLFPETVT